jgi:hypothetical protein
MPLRSSLKKLSVDTHVRHWLSGGEGQADHHSVRRRRRWDRFDLILNFEHERPVERNSTA